MLQYCISVVSFELGAMTDPELLHIAVSLVSIILYKYLYYNSVGMNL